MTDAPAYSHHREHLGLLIGAALQAADPDAAVRRYLSLQPDGVRVGQRTFRLTPRSNVYLIALGKAAPAMARAASDVLGGRLEGGVVTALTPEPLHLPDRVQVIVAGHPLPDAGSLHAGQAALDLARRAGKDDLIVTLISGGGSAMAECPVPGVGLDDLRRLTGLLLHAGAPIAAINSIRGDLSLLKGGGLASAAAPAHLAGLLLSDVVGDDPASIASGPTVPREITPGAARRALERLAIWGTAPQAVRQALSQPVAHERVSPPSFNIVVARNADMLRAAADQARAIGFPTKILTTRMQGEAFAVGKRLGTRLAYASRPVCLLAGGETTVTIRQRRTRRTEPGARARRGSRARRAAALRTDRVGQRRDRRADRRRRRVGRR